MQPHNIDLNLLRPLSVLLRLCNVTRAAEELNLSQSATSDALRRLRRALDDPLLVPHGRNLVRTPYAESIVGLVNDILRMSEQLSINRPLFDPGTADRTFTLMAGDYVLHTIGGPLLKHTSESAPGVRIEMRDLVDDFADTVRRDEVDVLITSATLAQHLEDLPRRFVFSDTMVCCGWSHSAAFQGAAAGPTLAAETFTKLGYVQYGPGDLVALADRTLRAAGLDPRVQARVESQLLVPRLLRGTDLIALVPRRLAETMAADNELAFVGPPVPIPRIEHFAAWHPRHDADPAHAWFLDLLCTLPGLDGEEVLD
ncbi:LysR substrate-binding domain-containing protein [Mycobacterium sp. 21AC1]|nr:LysR substrate-binding domain-containing protein [Mycobacterium sp. 21AC1]